MTDTYRMQIDGNIEKSTEQAVPFSYENIELASERRQVSQMQLQCEYDYFLAQQILESMLKNGLITIEEFNKITTLNRKSFSPALANIMPSNR